MHRLLWVEEPADKHYTGDTSRLTREERALFDDIRGGCYGGRVRLEQERIGFGWLEAALHTSG